jgi:hypothetical protein
LIRSLRISTISAETKPISQTIPWWFDDVFFKRDFVQKIFQIILQPNFSPNDKKATAIKIVDTFQDQIRCLVIFLLLLLGGLGYLGKK